ncbi:MAG TPA: cytochrome c [Tepidisphaeraceae bacterium]|nr:cytochrome c [Tepidisphaeraceae bacterium]
MSEQLPQDEPLAGERRNVDQSYLLLLVVAVCLIGTSVGFVLVLPSWKPKANMERQWYDKPYTESDYFADDRSERPLLSGVVPRPADQSPGIPYVMVRSPGPAGYPDIAKTENIPMPITRSLLERGQEQFNIYCAVCHSRAGDGDGMIVHRGLYSPPSFYIARLVKEPDSHFYNVISNGYGTMFSYSERVAPPDRWAITAYIRALQLAVHEHPELEKRLQKERGVQQP